MIDLVSVGRKINTLRSQKNLSQDRLAETLLVSRQAVSAWETGKAAPSIDNVIELAKIFGVSFEEILCLGEKPVLNPDNPFDGHDREYVIRSVIANEIRVDIPQLFYHATMEERLRLIKAAQEGKIHLSLPMLQDQLTPEEMRLLKQGGNCS